MSLIRLILFFLSVGFMVSSCYVDKRAEPLSGQALHDFVVYVDSLTVAGDESALAVVRAYLDRHSTPPRFMPDSLPDDMERRRLGRYDSSQTARLYGYLAHLYFLRGDTAAVLTVRMQGGPYMSSLDTLTQIRMERWLAFAYRTRGHAGLALTAISRSMRLAELSHNEVEYELSAVCWRSLMDSGAVARVAEADDERSFLWWGVLISVVIYAWKLRQDRRPPGVQHRP